MNKIAFVIDSVACVPAEYVQKYNIHVVPNIVVWSGKEYRDGIDITPSELFARLKTDKDFPTTAAVGPEVYKQIFEGLLADGFEILGVFQSSKISRTFFSAQEARDMIGSDKVTVIDSQTMGMAVAWPLILAARAAEKGASYAECIALVHKGLKNTGSFGTVDSLEHAQRSGRIGWAQRYMGSMLNVKPILDVVDGQFEPVGRVRTRRKALLELVEMTVTQVNGRSPLHIAIVENDAGEDAQSLLTMLKERLEPEEAFVTAGSPIPGVILGPGSIAVCFVAGVSEP